MVATAQKELNLYSGLAQATEGRVSPDKGKNCWYLIEFKCDKAGQWKVINNPGGLFVETRHGKRKIKRLWNDTAARILGVWMAPDRSSTQQRIELEKKTKTWANR
eukprot:11112057-Ditylum_brightwellii.AAC.1